MSNGSVTIKDVAQRAGFSHITVSRVLNKPEGMFPISEETRRKVTQCAKELNYHPNFAAKAMRTQRTGIIALIYCREQTAHFTDDSFYMGVQGGIEETLADNGNSLLICACSQEDVANKKVPSVIQQGLADGVLAFQIYEKPFIEALAKLARPLVLVNFEMSVPGLGCVTQSNADRASGMAERLVGWGHKHIALVTSRVDHDANSRFQAGFRSAIARHRLYFPEEWLLRVDSFSGEAGDRAVEIKNKFPELTAIACVSDGMAATVVIALREAGLRVPEDISVTGFGAYPDRWIRQCNLTTETVAVRDLGEEAVKMVLERIKGFDNSNPVKSLSGKFVRGATAGPCPG